MEQLNFFNNSTDYDETSPAKSHQWLLFVDGASRNNPGPAGAGIFLIKDKVPVFKEGFFLGIKTNNQAEYLALLLGLFFLEQQIQRGDTVRIVSDSELLVKQIAGAYRVRRPHLKPLHALARQKTRALNAHVVHVFREENVEADKMANYGIDNKRLVPDKFIDLLKRHEIVF